MIDWDYIVIGAGSSGCVVTYQLSQSGNKRILMLEAGPSNRSVLFRVPIAAIYLEHLTK
jgi:choline dehydrogenase